MSFLLFQVLAGPHFIKVTENYLGVAWVSYRKQPATITAGKP
jgi:hypothetical protein